MPSAVKSENNESDSSFKNSTSSETPIDCPLRKKGIVHDHAKPFEHTDRYIDFLANLLSTQISTLTFWKERTE
jgi:hypothetical protein